MKKRKQYIIDKGFQVKTTFSIIGIVFVLIAIIVAIIGINVAINNKKLSNIIQIQKNMVEALIVYSQSSQQSDQKNAMTYISNNHDKNTKTINEIIYTNNLLIFSIVIIVILQGILLYIILIRKTHKIAGPIYVMSNYIKEILDGKNPQLRPLRKNDELQEFYALFQELINQFKIKKD